MVKETFGKREERERGGCQSSPSFLTFIHLLFCYVPKISFTHPNPTY